MSPQSNTRTCTGRWGQHWTNIRRLEVLPRWGQHWTPTSAWRCGLLDSGARGAFQIKLAVRNTNAKELSKGSVVKQTGRGEYTRAGNVANPLKWAAYHEVGNPRQKRAVLAVELRHPVVVRALHAAPTPVVTVSCRVSPRLGETQEGPGQARGWSWGRSPLVCVVPPRLGRTPGTGHVSLWLLTLTVLTLVSNLEAIRNVSAT